MHGVGLGKDIVKIIDQISVNRKTGLLIVLANGDQAQIAFEDGHIIGAMHAFNGITVPIQQYVYRFGFIDSIKMSVLSRMRDEDGLSFEEVMIHSGVIDLHNLGKIISFKVREILLELTTWENINYSFLPDISLYNRSAFQLKLDTAEKIKEIESELDEWRQLAEFFLKPDKVFIPSGRQLQHQLNRDQSVVYRFVILPTDLETLVESSGLGRYRTYQAIYELMKLGLLDYFERD